MYRCEIDLVLEKDNIIDLKGLTEGLSSYGLSVETRESDIEWYGVIEEDFNYTPASWDEPEELDCYTPSEVRADIMDTVSGYVIDTSDIDLCVCAEDAEFDDFIACRCR